MNKNLKVCARRVESNLFEFPSRSQNKRRSLKIFFLVFAFIALALPAGAQKKSTMTDSEIMEYIIRENEKGTSRQNIMIQLMEKGVTVDRVRKIRRKYEKQQNGDVLGARNISGYDSGESDRLRKRKVQGDDYDDDEEGNYTQRRRAYYDDIDESTISERQRRLREERRRERMSDELDFVLPDTLDMYDDIMGGSRKKKGKQVFGRNIFNNKKLTFESDLNIATPADYVLGTGDVVYIDIWGASHKTFQSTVSPEGSIDLEGYGPVSVGGLTVAQAQGRLQGSVGRRYADSNLRLTVGQTKTISVNVVGEVKRPGTYTLSAFATVFNALYMAGGTNEIGTLRNIKVYRGGVEISNVDIYDYILNGRLSGNVRLQSGDVIIVGAYDCLVQIDGKVRRPMFYEMRSDESLATLIAYAGGFTGDAYQGSVRVVRKAGGRISVYTVDEFERGEFSLYDADSVHVDSTLNRYANAVELKGAVQRPGLYQMDGSVTTVRDLLLAAGGLKEDAFKDHAVMHRRKEDHTLEVISVDVEGIMNHSVPNIALKNEDVLFIPSKQDLQSERYVSIQGEVNFPGEYEYADNMTLEDFVLQAGGLKDAASTVKVDVSRRVRNQKATKAGQNIAQQFSFSLKEGFVIDGEQGFVLQPFDEVYVRRSPGYFEQEHITVSGEVAFEGVYTLTRKNSRLSDAIKEAGGLSAEAYAKGARLERKLTAEEKIKQETMYKVIMAGDSTNLAKVELSDTRSVGINLDMALANPGNDQWDIVLKDGDKIVVPQYNNTVSVNGEVMYPNTVAYKEGEGLNYYINSAGGYGMRAKKSHIFAVNMNGTVTKIKKAADIQPGCEIVVPSKQKRNGLSFGEIISLSTMGVSMAAVLATLAK